MLKLTSIFDPILGPIWLHFGSQNRPKSVKNTVSKSILFLINFKLQFLTNFGPNDAQRKPQMDPKGVAESTSSPFGVHFGDLGAQELAQEAPRREVQREKEGKFAGLGALEHLNYSLLKANLLLVLD